MGKLVDPGVGEVSDRLSILSLKVLFGEQAGKDVAHFKKEKAALLTKLRAQTLNGVWFEAYSELAAVNAALWHAEDDLRDLRERYTTGGSHQDLDFMEVAVAIQTLNDRRATLVGQINTETGGGAAEEKL